MNDSDPYDVTQDQQGNPISSDDAPPAQPLKQIGRYRIEKILGKGGFGVVYLAYDEQLDRLVAIKVPHAKLIFRREDAEAYLAEARTVANLDHSHIVPVFDVGSTEEFPCYIVSKYIEGMDLATKIKESRLRYRDAAELVATVGEALHYAHKRGLVHRDVKPGNILICKDGQPYIVDFGLALREESIGKGPKYAGTPAYMSPEQARSEGHRVDGRSDVFSLGVVFYELLAGRQPFRGDTKAELLEQVASYEAKPLRQYDEKLPKELERICHKAMAKRVSERYSSAHDFAEDLRLFLAEQAVIQSGTSPGGVTPVAASTQGSTQGSTSVGSMAASPVSMSFGPPDSQPIRIVPKGLRSFDAHDADFFLALLPGPRDRDGLPDSLRFWKIRIEETDSDNTFSVGLIYGPSGCGKSSLVKAGLLPRLSEDVIPVYVEATPEEIETRLLHGLRKRCPALEDNLSLKDTLAALRRGQGIPVGKKALIVLDQFEQWLHAKKEEDTDLVQALRQCDGEHVQCIVMVRDDFWMAVTRFGVELEVDFLPGNNMSPVDLFPPRHAEKVLAAFGRAFGTLPDEIEKATKEQMNFIKQSVAGLAEDGKVICVRLALFAEMMKGRDWTLATLKELGGTQGVGVTFLEEIFSAQTAVPRHRLHQKAARAVLRALLPNSGWDIKGAMRSYAELLDASGYCNRPKDFDDLIRILDSEIRLITPTDPEGKDIEDDSVTQTQAGQKHFQLTHDYLVHSLRDWLTRKQKETRRGKAELNLFDTSVTWNAKPENRFLPSWWEHFTIRLLTDKKKWTEPQRKMMGKAGQVHGMRSVLVLVALLAVILGGISVRSAVLESQNATRAKALVDSLASADITRVPAVISDLNEYREWAAPLLKAKISRAEDGSAEKLQLAMALLPVDDSQIEYLQDLLPVCSLAQFPVLRTSLLPHKDKLTEMLWQVVTDEKRNAAHRFQAATALAQYTPDDERWQWAAPFVSQHLTTAVPSVHIERWQKLLQPAGERLTAALTDIHASRTRSNVQREAAAFVLSEYLRNQPDKLVDAILVADELAEFSVLVAALRPHATTVEKRLLVESHAVLSPELDKANNRLSEQDQQLRDNHWKRQSLAAVTLLQLGMGADVWSLLAFTPNPSLRSYIIHHLGKLGTDHNLLAARLQMENEVSIRRSLIQSLGGLNAEFIPVADRNRIAEQLKSLYVHDTDSGVHSSASWTLRQWGVPLPELPIGEPTLSEEQRANISKKIAEVQDIRQRRIAVEENTLERQSTWERQLRNQPTALPASLSEGLVAHFPMDEKSGISIANRVDGGTSGTYAGPGHPDWVPGVMGNAVRLNGNGGHFSCGQSFSPERTDAFSYGCWFLASTAAKRNALLGRFANVNEKGFAVSLDQSKGDIVCEWSHHWPDNTVLVRAELPELEGQWHHLFVVYDGSSRATGIRVYLNGRPVPVRIESDSLSESIQVSGFLQIGSRDGWYPFQGAIDDVRIYNRSLSRDEVRLLFGMGLQALAGVATEIRTPEQQAFLSAAFYLQDAVLQRMESELAVAETALHDSRWNGVRHWYVNSQGQTMVVIPSTADLGDSKINQSCAIASHEVTVAEFRRFRDQQRIDASIAPTENCPVHFVSWYEAAAYCNWLSQQEGIPETQWAYVPNGNGQYAAGMSVSENAPELWGYRLPTEAEWEYACRAGTSSTYASGESEALVQSYACYVVSSLGRCLPVESLMPNDFGLFDMHGSVAEWTDTNSFESSQPVSNQLSFSVRGGSFQFLSPFITSNNSTPLSSTFSNTDVGFRVVRTFPTPD